MRKSSCPCFLNNCVSVAQNSSSLLNYNSKINSGANGEWCALCVQSRRIEEGVLQKKLN